MMLLVSGAHTVIRRYGGLGHLGWLVTPSNGTSLETISASGLPFGCDNDCYQQLDRQAYLSMIRRVAAHDRRHLLFVVAPDVVANAHATVIRWRMWQPALAYYGLPAAFVAQDGQQDLPVPWDQMAALFIGGSTAWKEGPQAATLIQQARLRRIHVHVGRVTTLRRMRLMDALGADSFDGSIFSKMPAKFVPWMLGGLDYRQHGMLELLCSEEGAPMTDDKTAKPPDKPNYLGAIVRDMIHRAGLTGRPSARALSGGAALLVIVQADEVRFVVSRAGKPLGDVELRTFERVCVPAGAVRSPQEGQACTTKDTGSVWRVGWTWTREDADVSRS